MGEVSLVPSPPTGSVPRVLGSSGSGPLVGVGVRGKDRSDVPGASSPPSRKHQVAASDWSTWHPFSPVPRRTWRGMAGRTACVSASNTPGRRRKAWTRRAVAAAAVSATTAAWIHKKKHQERSRTPVDAKAKGKDPRKHVLILMSDTGGGHRASAQALEAAFHEMFPQEFRVSIVDLLSHHMPYPFNQAPKTYSFMVKYPVLWRIMFRLTEPAWVHNLIFRVSSVFNHDSVRRAYEEFQPDMVVSVHPLTQDQPIKALRQYDERHVPFATVITDLTSCHPTWFNKYVDKCFVPTEQVKEQALKRGLVEEQIVVHGLPIRPAFSKAPAKSKEELRGELGLHKDGPVVLLVGGGDGMGPVETTCSALASRLSQEAQIAVVCGRNQRLIDKLNSREWPVPVLVQGFVNNMSDWMAAADCIITKAGPGTIAESLIRGLPLVLNGCIPCQEEGNVQYVLQNNLGQFSREPEQIADIVSNWFQGEEGRKVLQRMSKHAKSMGHPDATFRIAEDLATLCRSFYKEAADAENSQPLLQPA